MSYSHDIDLFCRQRKWMCFGKPVLKSGLNRQGKKGMQNPAYTTLSQVLKLTAD